MLDRAVEYDRKTKATKELGKILLKGENIVLVRTLEYLYRYNIFRDVKLWVNAFHIIYILNLKMNETQDSDTNFEVACS